MIILFANSKGGTGKSTLTVLFTQYLINYILGREIQEKKCAVMVVDADYRQKSINRLRMKDIEKLGNRDDFEWNYQFYPIHGTDKNNNKDENIAFTELNQIIETYHRQTVVTHLIVDLPGTLSDLVISMVNIADIMIIPFEPTEIELNATYDFLRELSAVNTRMDNHFLTTQKIFMIPNKLQKGIKYSADTESVLNHIEESARQIIPSVIFTPPVPMAAQLKRTTSMAVINQQQATLVSSSFSVIVSMGELRMVRNPKKTAK